MRTLSLLLSSLLFCVSSLQAAEAIVSRDAQIDNVQLHYLTAGHGSATVILLHGFAETSRMWRPIIPLLAEKFTVIAPDLPSIGDSSIPAKTGMLIAAQQIHELVRSLKIEKARVVGHDKGGSELTSSISGMCLRRTRRIRFLKPSARLIPLPMPDLGGCERPGLTSRRGRN